MELRDFAVLAIVAAWFLYVMVSLVKRRIHGKSGCACCGNCAECASKCKK